MAESCPSSLLLKLHENACAVIKLLDVDCSTVIMYIVSCGC